VSQVVEEGSAVWAYIGAYVLGQFW